MASLRKLVVISNVSACCICHQYNRNHQNRHMTSLKCCWEWLCFPSGVFCLLVWPCGCTRMHLPTGPALCRPCTLLLSGISYSCLKCTACYWRCMFTARVWPFSSYYPQSCRKIGSWEHISQNPTPPSPMGILKFTFFNMTFKQGVDFPIQFHLP